MQVGDLVELSSYGANRRQNMDCYGGFGIVVDFLRESRQKYPITTCWYKKDGKVLDGMKFHPRELKRFKPDKK